MKTKNKLKIEGLHLWSIEMTSFGLLSQYWITTKTRNVQVAQDKALKFHGAVAYITKVEYNGTLDA